MPSSMPFKISVLVFLKDAAGRLLLIERRKAPNKGFWSPPGGKLEMALGESPFECAVREVAEETGLSITYRDLHLFGMISEKNYEGNGHWLMFLFDCSKVLENLPPESNEGQFRFFTREKIDELPLPPTDRHLLWPYYDGFREHFIALRADCHPQQSLQIVVEECHRAFHNMDV